MTAVAWTATPTTTLTAAPTTTPTITPTPTLTAIPTATPLVQGNIFFDPLTVEDFSRVAQAPSPIDNPTDFAKWQDEYLKQVNEKLKTYQGYSISTDGIRIDFRI